MSDIRKTRAQLLDELDGMRQRVAVLEKADSEHRHVEEDLRKQNEELQMIFDSVPAFIFYKDKDGRIIRGNAAVARAAKIPREQWEGKTVFELIPGMAESYHEDDMEVVSSGKPKKDIIEPFETSKGVRWLQTNKLPVKDKKGNVTGLIGFSVDMTDRVQIEEALRENEEKLRTIFDSIRDAVSVADLEGRVVEVNDAAVRLGGYKSKKEILGCSGFDFVVEEDKPKAIEGVKKLFKKGHTAPIEYRFRRKDGTVFDAEASAAVLHDASGEAVGFVSVVRDVTEQKRMEVELRQSEENYRMLAESTKDAIYSTDAEGRITYIGPQVNRYGITPEEIVNHYMLDFIYPDDREKVLRDYERTISAGEEFPTEFRITDREGNIYWIEEHGTVRRDADGVIIGITGVLRDITDRKRAEEEVKASEKRCGEIINQVRDVVFGVDGTGTITSLNSAVRQWGYEPEELIGTNFLGLIPKDWQEKTAVELQNALLSAGELVAETWIVDKDGNRCPIEYSATVRHEGGQYVGAQGVVRNIAERKRIEEELEEHRQHLERLVEERTIEISVANVKLHEEVTHRKKVEAELRESEQKYRQLVEMLQEGIWQIDAEGVTTYVNPRMAQMLGYSVKEMMGKHLFAFMDEAAAEDAREKMERRRRGISEQHEFEFIRKDGSKLYAILATSPVTDDSGNYAGAIAGVQDITGRREMEKQLRESESRFRELFQHMSSGVAVYEATKDGGDFIFKDFNAAAEKISKLRKRDFVGKSVLKTMPGLKDYGLFEVLQTVWKTGKPVHFPGSYYIDERVAGWRDNYVYRLPSGEVVAVYDDITDRVESERALRESEEKLRTMFESMMEGVLVTDLQGNIVEVNNSAAQMARSSREGLIGRSVFEFMAEEHRASAAEELAKALAEGTTRKELEYDFLAADGSRIEAEFSASLLCDSEGNPSGIIGIARDVTERKRMEDALRESEEKLRTMFESIGDAITVTDLEGKITELNKAAVRVFGVKSKKAAIGQEGFKFIAEKDHARTMEDMAGLFEQESRGPVEYTFRKANGEEFEVESSNAVLRDAAGNPTGFVSINRDITERKHMEQALRDSEEKLRAIFDAISDGIAVTDLEINIVQANEAVTRMAGYKKKEQLLGKNALEWIAPEDIEKAMAPMAEAVKGRPIERGEFKIRPPKGKEFLGEIGISPLRDSAGNMTGFVTVIRDVTERKQMERELRDSEEKLRTIFEAIPDGVTITDMEGRIVEENSAGLRMSGYSRKEDVMGLSGFDFMVDEDRERAIANMSSIYDTGLGIPGEYRMRTADGLEYDAEIISAMMRDADGQPSGIVAVVRDITERKRSDEVLRQSEEKYRSLVDHMQEGYLIVRSQHIVFANERCTEFLGIPLDRIVGQSIWDFILPEDIKKAEEMADLFIAGKEPSYLMEFGYYREDGKMVPLEVNLKGIKYEGKPALSVVMRDITERKQMEEELRESEEKLRTMFDTMREGIILVDLEGKVVDVNEATLRIGGRRSKKELIGKNGFDMIVEKDRERLLKDFMDGLAGKGGPSRWEATFLKGDGSEFIADLSSAMLRDSAGNPTGFIGVIRDITERKRMEEELRRISIAVESSSDAIGMSDPQGRHFYQNRAFTELFEYTPQELEAAGGGPAAYANKDVGRKVFDAIMSGGSWSGEVEMVSKRGRKFPVLLRADAVRDDAGNIIGLVGVHTDITEQKRSQEALRDSEEKLRFMFASITDAVVVVDLDGKVIEVNDAGLRLTGYGDKEELIGQSAFDFMVDEDREKAINDMAKSFETGPGFLVQYRLRNRQGGVAEVEAAGGMLRDGAGNVTGFINVVRDITESKRMEEALRASEEKLRFMFSSIIDAVVVVDLEGKIMEVNDAGLRLTGYSSKEELMGMSAFEFIAEEDRDKAVNDMLKSFEVGPGFEVQYRFRNKQGDLFYVEARGGMLYDASGEITGHIVIVRDITERRRMVQALRESEEKLRNVFETTTEGMAVTDMNAVILDINEAAVRMHGYSSRKELIGRSSLELISEKDRKKAANEALNSVKQGSSSFSGEYTLVRADGTEFEAEYSGAMMHDASGNPVGYVGVSHDVTERRRMVQALRESEEKLRAIFEAIQDGVTVIDIEGNIVQQNEAARRMLGYGRKESMIGTSGMRVVAEKDLNKAAKYMEKVAKKGRAGTIEYSLLTKGGEEIDAEVRAAALRDSEGNPVGIVGVARDITGRKRMQEELKNSEEKLRFMFESIADGIISVDMEGKITEVNEAIVRMAGYGSKEEMLGVSAFDFVAERDRERALAENVKNINEGHGSAVRYVAVDKDGNEFMAESVGSMLLDNEGSPIGFITVVRDVTERQRMEQALRESEEKLRSIFETSPDFIMSIARDGTLLFINRTVPELTVEQAVGTCAYDYIMPESRDDYEKAIGRVFETAEPMTFETSGLGPDGRTSYYESRLTPVARDGEVMSVTAVATDITERRRAEEAVRESEERYRTLVEGAGTPITTFDREGKIIVMNETSARYFGVKSKDFIGKTMHDLFPQAADVLLERNSRIFETGVVEEHEDLLPMPEGDRWFLSSLQPVAHPDGEIYAVQVISYDITDRRVMEKTLRDSEEKLRFMFESMGDAIVVVDMEGKVTELNDQLLSMSGYESRDEVLGMNAFDFVAERDRTTAIETFTRNVEQEINATVEYVAVDKYGREFDVEANGAMLKDDEGNAVGFIIALRDISERKIMEQKLKDSEELARGMLESAATGIYMVQNNKFEYVSPMFVGISGYTEEELLGTGPLGYVYPDDRDKVKEEAVKSLKGGSGLPYEFRFVKKDGTKIWILEKVASIKYKGELATIASFMDITEYKRAEQAVIDSEEKLRSFMDSATDFFTIWDSELNLVDLNEAALKYPVTDVPGGIDKTRVIGKNMASLDPGVKRGGRYEQFIEVIRTGKPFFSEDIVKHPRLGELHMAISAFKAGEGLGIIASDVTERRRAEDELRQRKDELEKRANQLLALQKVATSIQSSLELDEVLQQVAEGVVDNLGYDQSFILVVDEKADVYRGRTSYSKRPEEFRKGVQEIIGMQLSDIVLPRRKGFVAGLDASMDGRLMITPKFSDMAEPMLDKKQANAIQKLLGAKTVISMPLFAMDRHVGGIIAFTARAEVTESDVEPLRLLADQVGIAIVNARAYEVTAEMAQRLAVTSTLSRILGSSLDIDEVYQTFTEEIGNVIGFERANIALVEGDRLRLVSISPESKVSQGGEELLPLAGSVTEWAIENKQTNIEPDFTVEKRFPLDEVYAGEGLRSAIRVPLFSKGEAFGSFELVSREPNAYGEREQGILEQVAGSIATAVENSRLFTQVKEHEAELIKAYDELKTAQEYILQAEKLRALGEMAGGVAHDFNNILAIILGRAQLALEDVKDDKLKRDLQIIEQTAIDAASTVRRLQDFARVRVDRTFGEVDLNKLVEGALEMVESRRMELKETAGLDISISADMEKLPPVSGDTAELRESLVNIIFNAMDAMPEGGSIVIKGVQEDGRVVLSVKDTGVGIPEDVKGRIFDPFFTTRSPKGSGLGLSVTYGIITRHGGVIEVESEEGQGTTFFIRLPVAAEAKKEEQTVQKSVAVENATVLLVDDDPDVSEVLELMLKQLGHKVVSVNTGEAAVNTFEVGDYDLVITDLGMPDMSGREVAAAVKDIKPGTPVVLITGWGVQLDQEDMPEIDGVVAKPFSKESLSERIDALLSDKGATKKRRKKKGPK